MTHCKLSSGQMARFVSDGFLRFDEIVPRELCADALEEMRSHALPTSWPDSTKICSQQFNEVWQGTACKRVFELPQVQGIIESLVGTQPLFDHHAVHIVEPNCKRAANLHQDSMLDLRERSFDIQLSFFPHDITAEMGGTLFVPGSHFHKPRLHPLGRYHHIRGQQQTVCKAGTVVAWHHNLWHSARSNYSNQTRYMFKLRLNPRQPQVQLWDCHDLDDFDPYGPLCYNHGWFGDEWRHVLMQRARLWANLTGNPQFDIQGYWTRLRNQPQKEAHCENIYQQNPVTEFAYS